LLGVAIVVFVVEVLWGDHQRSSLGIGGALVLGALILVPGLWSYDTVAILSLGGNLPAAYSGQSPSLANTPFQQRAFNINQSAPVGNTDQDLIDFLQAHTQDVYYMVAVVNAQTGAPLVIATGRPVLYMGGFTGSDPVIDANGISNLVQEGKLRYVLLGGGIGAAGRSGNSSAQSWVAQNCSPVSDLNQTAGTTNLFRNNFGGSLYQCGSTTL
jgi:4-amino-4-deoxy-L-arabinose transferase-like glycosyltransferase